MCPLIIAIVIQIVAKVPGDVGESSKTVHSVVDETIFVVAGRRWMNFAVTHVENDRYDHVALSGETHGAFKLLPIRDVKPCLVEARMIYVIGLLGGPRCHIDREVIAKHDGLSVEHVCPSGDGHADAIDLQAMQPFKAVLNYPVVLPTD